MKKKKLNLAKKFIILGIMIISVAGAGILWENFSTEEFSGNVLIRQENYSDVEEYLSSKNTDITKVKAVSFTASNNTDTAVCGGVVRFGALILGETQSGEEEYYLTNDVTVSKNSDIKIIRPYVAAIPDNGSDEERSVSMDVSFLGRTETFTYDVVMQEMSNKNTSILVNPYMGVGDNFKPHATKTVGGRKMSTLAAGALQEMFDAAKEDGYNMWVNSGYRGVSEQRYLYNRAVAKYGPDQNDTAVPGHSEHHTGFAADLTWTSREGYISNNQVYDDEYDWLMENCHKYGFILRYTKGSEDITGYIFEPWHYRYIGTELATQYHDEGWCTLDEFFCIPRW